MDSEIKKLIDKESTRQGKTINLIASENFASEEVLLALSSPFGNKYAEGYPGSRYYAGVSVCDELEILCKKRALEVFGLNDNEWSVNVQPLSGAPANFVVYSALVDFGGKLMSLDLSHGGHLSHGSKVSVTGKLWENIAYEVERDTFKIDYEKLDSVAKGELPDMIIAGYSAYPFEIDWESLSKTSKECGSYLHADISHIAGLIVGGLLQSPFEYADTVVTTTHKSLRGPRSAIIFSRKDNRELPKKIDKALFPGFQGGPHMNQIAAVAVSLKEALDPKFKEYVKQVALNAKSSADACRDLGLSVIGTDSHLFLIDLIKSGFSFGGDTAQRALEENGIIVNKNGIPFDTRKPMDPSGIRIGTYAETTRGLKKEDFVEIMGRIDKILRKI